MRRLRFRFAMLAMLAACGSRTGLFVDDVDYELIDGGPLADGGRRDTGLDGEDQEDALPPIDARPPVDVIKTDCPDADATLIYVITESYELFSFFPPDGSFRFIGRIACPSSDPSATPFSMAVDRKGTAFVLFSDERLYRVSTLNAACAATSYRPRQFNYSLFGMGFATNDIGPTETLFVAGDERNAGADGLARIDPKTFTLSPVGSFTPTIRYAELTGRGDGRLFAYYRKGTISPPSYIGEIEPTSGRIIGEKRLATVDQGEGWAFAFWGGDFYVFHAPGGSSRVTRYRPSDDSVVQVGTLPTVIVGAGVSTCAPEQ